MKVKKRAYNIFQLLSAIFMILALLWLTISAPFVVAGQQQMAKYEHAGDFGSPYSNSEEDAANPFGNNTEEKSPSSSSVSEEYLHDHHKSEYLISVILRHHKHVNADTYIAYHGELLVPPPNLV